MAKVRLQITLTEESVMFLDKFAAKNFRGNRSAAAEFLIQEHAAPEYLQHARKWKEAMRERFRAMGAELEFPDFIK